MMFGFICFIRLTASSPLIPGMLMSIKRMSMFLERTSSSAFVPEFAVKIFTCSAKFLFKIMVRESVTIFSSSVNKMLYTVFSYLNLRRYLYVEHSSASVRVFRYAKNICALKINLQARDYVY